MWECPCLHSLCVPVSPHRTGSPKGVGAQYRLKYVSLHIYMPVSMLGLNVLCVGVYAWYMCTIVYVTCVSPSGRVSISTSVRMYMSYDTLPGKWPCLCVSQQTECRGACISRLMHLGAMSCEAWVQSLCVTSAENGDLGIWVSGSVGSICLESRLACVTVCTSG